MATTWWKIIPLNDDVLEDTMIDASLTRSTIPPERWHCRKYMEVACDLGAQIQVKTNEKTLILAIASFFTVNYMFIS